MKDSPAKGEQSYLGRHHAHAFTKSTGITVTLIFIPLVEGPTQKASGDQYFILMPFQWPLHQPFISKSIFLKATTPSRQSSPDIYLLFLAIASRNSGSRCACLSTEGAHIALLHSGLL